MAEAVDDIVQRLILAGDSDVIAAFDRIQAAGTRAFDAVGAAVNKIGSGGSGGALATLTSGFGALGLAVAGVTAAVGIASVGMFEFVRSQSEAVDGMADLATQTDQSIEDMSSFAASMTTAGVSSTELSGAFKRLSVSIQQSWSEIKRASATSADTLRGDAASIGQALQSLENIQRQQNNLLGDQAQQRRNNVNSIREAQQRLDELNARSLKNAGVDTSALEQQLAVQRELIELESARNALAQAKKKAQDDAEQAAQRAEQLELQRVQAEIAVNAARRKAAEDAANDINNVTEAVKQLAAGNENALQGINASAENIAKGIINSAAQGEEAFTGLRDNITDLTSPAPGVKAVFDQMSRVFSNTEDNALKTATAFRLLGRNVSQSFIEALSQGPEKLAELQKRLIDLGLATTAVDDKISKDFRAALFGLQSDIAQVAVKISSAFGPAFTTILKAIDDAIIRNRQNIIDFATTIAARAVPVMESFIRVLSGAGDATKDQWLIDYTNKIKAVATVAGQVAGVIISVFSRIGSILSGTADGINSTFGTNLNAVDVLFAAFFLRNIVRLVAFTGAFQAAGAAIAAGLSQAVAANGLLAVIGAFTTLAARIAVVVGLITELYQLYKLFNESEEKKDVRDAARSRRQELERAQRDPDTRLSPTDFAKKQRENNIQMEEELAAIDKREAERKKVNDDIDKQIAENAERRRKRQAGETVEDNDTILESYKKTLKEIEEGTKKTSDATARNFTEGTQKTKKAIDDTKQATDDLKRAQEVAAIGGGSVAGQGVSIKGAFSLARDKVEDKKSPVRTVKEDVDAMNESLKKTGEFITSGGAKIIQPGVTGNKSQELLAAEKKAFQENTEEARRAWRTLTREGQDIDHEREQDVTRIGRPGDGTMHLPRQDFGDRRNGIFDQGPFSNNGRADTWDDFLNGRFKDPLLPKFDKEEVPLPRARPDFESRNNPIPVEVVKIDGEAGRAGNLGRPLQEDISSPIPGGAAAETPTVPPVMPPTFDAFQNFLPFLQQQPPIQPDLSPPEAGGVNIFQSILEQLNELLTKQNQDLKATPENTAQMGTRAEGDVESSTQSASASLDALGSSATALASAIDSAASAIESAASRLSSGSDVVRAAGGGHIRGPGGPTGDKIPALLSDYEYVQPASATKFWGVPFMDAIRQMRMPEIPRFALGGLASFVSPSIPRARFAGGGLAAVTESGGGRHLGTVDLRTNSGDIRVGVSESSVSQLKRAAVTQRITSTTNRKPGYVS